MSDGTRDGDSVKHYEAVSMCQKGVLLNEVCSFAVLLQSVRHGKE
jgi:hypothetical protein